MRIVVLMICFGLLSGCASNGYKEFYNEFPIAEDVRKNRVAPAPAEPNVDRLSGNFQDYFPQYVRAGYVAIGYSSYNGPDGNEAGAIAQAKAVGADVVVVMSPRYTETRTASIPITTPTTQTSHTSSTATVFGAGGMATGYGNSTTTTYGSRTTYVPITTTRYDFEAIYLIKRKFRFGAYFDELSDEERAAIQSNKGVRVINVVNNTPAFDADILVGDIILGGNGGSISTPKSLSELIESSTQVELTILRNGQAITKTVRLLP